MIYHDPAFIQKMVARMTVSGAKYGEVSSFYPHQGDALTQLRERLRLYQDTGNTEHLVDVANYAMIEFMAPAHPDAHYDPDTESPGLQRHDGSRFRAREEAP